MQRAEPPGTSPTEESRYRLLVEAVTDYAIYMLDPKGFVTSWNPGAQRFKGYQRSEILGHHFSRFYTDEDRRAGLPDRALETAAREGRFENEGWRLRKDGTRFWAHVVIDPIRDSSGTLLGFAKITRDLTERKLAEEAVRHSEERFRLLVQGVTDYAIYMLDPEGRVTNWNPGAQNIKGYLPDEIIGEHFSRFYTEEDRERAEPKQALEIAAREGRFEKEAWRVRKDGTRFWASVVIDAIRDSQGSLIGYAKVTRDLTDRRRLEAELTQASKMATLGTLAAGIAHELNQPLNIIRMWSENGLERLRSGQADMARYEQTLKLIVDQTKRMAAIIQHMQTFSRADQSTMGDFDPAQSARAAIEMVEHRYALDDIAIEANFSEQVCEVYGAAVQLEQVVLNLLSNARDAIISKRQGEEPRAGLIVVGMTFAADTMRANIEVSDNGGGIPEEVLGRVFDPFFTTKEVGQGTGLGLSISYSIVQLMGGRLDVSNVARPGGEQGACFSISLPAHPIEQTQRRR